MAKVLMEPVRGLSEKQKRQAKGLRLQRMIAKLLADQRASNVAGLAACMNLATLKSIECGVVRPQFLEMCAQVYDEAFGAIRRGGQSG
jgi:hypothetical protein